MNRLASSMVRCQFCNMVIDLSAAAEHLERCDKAKAAIQEAKKQQHAVWHRAMVENVAARLYAARKDSTAGDCISDAEHFADMLAGHFERKAALLESKPDRPLQ